MSLEPRSRGRVAKMDVCPPPPRQYEFSSYIISREIWNTDPRDLTRLFSSAPSSCCETKVGDGQASQVAGSQWARGSNPSWTSRTPYCRRVGDKAMVTTRSIRYPFHIPGIRSWLGDIWRTGSPKSWKRVDLCWPGPAAQNKPSVAPCRNNTRAAGKTRKWLGHRERGYRSIGIERLDHSVRATDRDSRAWSVFRKKV